MISGNGSKEQPYIVNGNKEGITLGSYITIDEDTWIVSSVEEGKLKLIYSELYNKGNSKYRFDTEKLEFDLERENSLAKLLNDKFYNELSYKDLLLEFDLYTETYTDTYENVYEEKETVKVGIPSVVDLKFNNEADGYFLSSKSPREGRIYYYQGDLISSKPGISRPYRPVIMIEMPEVSEGDGTKENPFKVEV